MKRMMKMAAGLAAGLTASAVLAGLYGDTPDAKHAWAVHDMNRPNPAKITAEPGQPPSDAVVLFNGTSLENWESTKGEPTKWRLVDGAMESVKGAGYIRTKQAFGDCQLHLEWAAPSKVEGMGQGRGNSGVFLMNTYEVQVLDSYEAQTYADGMAAAIYGQFPPLVNASRKPGEWQFYDIVFRAPRFAADGSVTAPARMTVFHNGILVHDNDQLTGPTGHKSRPPYKAHADRLPIGLQDHSHPVRFRNIWIRELK